MKKFIARLDNTNYYLVNEGMGGFLNPPDHPEHRLSIRGERGGHEVCSMSLTAALDNYYAGAIRGTAKAHLRKWENNRPAIPPQEWVKEVYSYFRHCYSKDGINRDTTNCITFGKFWDNAEQEAEANPYFHLGYMFVKSFYPVHAPDLELIKNPTGKE